MQLLNVFSLFSGIGGAREEVTRFTTGKEFVFAFMGSANAIVVDKGPKILLIADKDTKEDTQVTIKAADSATDVVIPAGESPMIELPASVLAINARDSRPDAVVHVTASHPITVYGLNDAYAHQDDPRADGFRVLSKDRLGKEYFTVSSYSHGSYSGKRAQFIIIGLEDYTEVSINLADAMWFDGGVVYGGSTKHLRVNRMQAVFFTSNGHQIGTQITSNKPISILAGHDCGVWDGNSPCEHQIEHLVPVHGWGRQFVLPEFSGYVDGSSQITILASQDGTNLELHDKSRIPVYNGKLHRGINPNNNESISWSSFEANKPVMVTAMIDHKALRDCQPPPCRVGAASTSAMTIIPPLTTFDGNIAFTHFDIRNADNTYNYATIMSECGNVDLLILNGETLRTWGAKEHFGDKKFCVATVELERDNIYYLTANASDIAISAIAYGFSGDASFAYPLL